MNEREHGMVLQIARRNGIHSGVVAEHFMMYGTGEAARRGQERAEWNARVDAKKRAKNARRA